jgi:hypothetical protein
MISNRDIFCLTEISDFQNVPHFTASGPVHSRTEHSTLSRRRARGQEVRGGEDGIVFLPIAVTSAVWGALADVSKLGLDAVE